LRGYRDGYDREAPFALPKPGSAIPGARNCSFALVGRSDAPPLHFEFAAVAGRTTKCPRLHLTPLTSAYYFSYNILSIDYYLIPEDGNLPPVCANVLIIDREESTRNSCVHLLRSLGFEPHVADSSAGALTMLKRERFDVILAEANGLAHTQGEFLRIIRHDFPNTEVILMTAPGASVKPGSAVDEGKFEFITKPLNTHDVKRVFGRLVEKHQERQAEERLQEQWSKPTPGLEGLIGSSPAMQKVHRTIIRVAAKRHPVLILGESGTGKEVVAHAIHACGPWSHRPFVPIDCAALPANLLESELFGHLRGAFTGASQERRGLLAFADDGTAFLDEIAELPVELQVKLLRALQEKEFKPIGSNERIRFEARIIAATNQDLEAAIERGRFRKDLYFRLNIVRIKLPPLRERREDIPALVDFFVRKHKTSEDSATSFSSEALFRLMTYDWPGNVRELENCVQRALAMGTGPEILVRDLPSSVFQRVSRRSSSRESRTLKDLERHAILQALQATQGDRVRAAKLLGISKTTIYRKLKEYGLEDDLGQPSSSIEQTS